MTDTDLVVVGKTTANRHGVTKQSALRALPPGPDTAIDRETAVRELSQQLGLGVAEAERVLAPLTGTIAQVISAARRPGSGLDDTQRLQLDLHLD